MQYFKVHNSSFNHWHTPRSVAVLSADNTTLVNSVRCFALRHAEFSPKFNGLRLFSITQPGSDGQCGLSCGHFFQFQFQLSYQYKFFSFSFVSVFQNFSSFRFSYSFSNGSLLLLNVEYLTWLATVCLIAGIMSRN